MTDPAHDQVIERAAGLLRNAHHAVAFTGAGISTPSGIPDFRSNNSGLWQQSDPMQVASLTSFRQTPQVFFNWLRPLAATITAAQPNPAHFALAELEKAGLLKAVITQNIDGLHQLAGSQNVFEVHGSMSTLTCLNCHVSFPSKAYYRALVAHKKLPLCPHCQKILKPDIVMFEEHLPVETWRAAEKHSREADVFLVAGSSLEVMPAAGLPLMAFDHNAAIIINNFTPTYIDTYAQVLLPIDVMLALPQITRLAL